MKYVNLMLVIIFLMGVAIMPGLAEVNTITGSIPPDAELPPAITALVKNGEYTKAQSAIKEWLSKEGEQMPLALRLRLLYEIERLDRIRLDFKLSREQVFNQIKEKISDLTPADFDRWENLGLFDYRIIDGKKLYFIRSRSNLFHLSREARERAKRDSGASERQQRIELMKKIMEAAKTEGNQFVLPQRYRVEMKITITSGTVPAGELIRCWMPFPRVSLINRDIKLLSTYPEKYFLAPPEQLQRSIYFEQPALNDKDTTFGVTYEFTAYASYVKVDPQKVKPYDTTSDVYLTYTAERPPHLKFTPALRKLAQEIVGDETNPYLKAKKIYGWVTENIRYTYAIEYSTIENISQYCYDNMRGDCGIQGLLFIVLCRISGVPARWESGWTITNMHDWAQFYIEPYGWLWADPSEAITDTDDPEIRWFLFGNVDNLRLVANDDYSMEFAPAKWFFRSEPVDFQRGEVEWRGGNLYYDKWDYDMKIKAVE